VSSEALPVPNWVQRGKLRWVWALWEPERFYRRAAYGGATSPGNALWMPQWYERMRSEETVKWLADIGVNLVSTCWFKGFGLQAEAQEMERSARFTDLCHRHGIRVLGYHQSTTLCWEALLDEAPNAEDWVQRQADGSLMCYGGGSAYWRWMACIRNEEHRAYLERVVRKCLEEGKMDGIEWDGNVYKCHCERCQQAFREYLFANHPDPEDLFGLPHLRHARIPPTENRNDPFFQALLRFREHTMREWLGHFNRLVKSINPEAAHVTYFISEWPDRPLDDIDILIDENHNVPYVQDDVLTCKLRGYKIGDARDRVVLVTAWMRAPSQQAPAGPPTPESTAAEVAAFQAPVGGLRRPETALEVKRDLAESVCHGGHVLTATYSLRGVGGDRVWLDQPFVHESLKQYFSFFAKYEQFYGESRSLANVALYRSHSSLSNDFFTAFPSIWGIEQVCLQYQIPFDTVFTCQLDRLADYAAVILADQRAMSDAEIETISAFVEAGGGLVLTGQSAMYDEHLRLRGNHLLIHLADRDNVVYLPDAPEKLDRPARDHPPAYNSFRLPERSDDIAAAIATAAGTLPIAIGRREPFLGVDVRELSDGTKTAHFLNYDNERSIEDLPVTLSGPLGEVASVTLYDPDSECNPIEIGVEPTGSTARLIIPRIETYALVCR